MHAISSIFLLGTYAVQAILGRPSPRLALQARADVESFIAIERPLALDGLLRNIGPNGSYAQGITPGVVIASPQILDPDYYYTWTRDSALVFKCLADIFVGNYDLGLQSQIENYITTQAQLQGVENPSGSLSNGAGLGEPKFNANLRPYKGSWGRPQNDGPALRAIALASYAKWLLANGYRSTVSDIVWPIMRNDLAYVAEYWNKTGFDLWEEVKGSSFFTAASQYRSLVEGSALAASLGTSCAYCDAVAPDILCFLQSFWSPSQGYLIANINTETSRGGQDANTLLASIHLFDPAAGCDAKTFQPCSDRALANHKAVVDAFRFYPINSGIPVGQAIALGRYAEDVYYDGNPWYLATLAAAESLYDAIYVWKAQEAIDVTSTSLAFFRDLSPTVSVGTFPFDSTTYSELFDAVHTYADGFVAVVAQYAYQNGSLSEQFNKNDGSPLSARDLTWSYASFLTATDRRAGVVPASWWRSSNVPGSCGTGSVSGSYSSVTPAPFPTSQTPITWVPPTTTTTTSTTPTGCATAIVVDIVFNELATTTLGKTIKIVGDIEDLGKWNTNNAISLGADDYTTTNPLWRTSVSFKAGQVIQYKYINVQADGSVRWEADPNHTYTVPHSCATEVAVNDRWQS